MTSAVCRVLMLPAVCIVASVAACTDFSAPRGTSLPDTLVAHPSFAADIQPIFTARCATQSCHNLATHQQDLVLDSAHSYDALIGTTSHLAPAFALVEPFRADTSWLVRMISADDAARLGFVRMPIAPRPLTNNQIATIVNWINDGAPRN